jgi:hypothetical protein
VRAIVQYGLLVEHEAPEQEQQLQQPQQEPLTDAKLPRPSLCAHLDLRLRQAAAWCRSHSSGACVRVGSRSRWATGHVCDADFCYTQARYQRKESRSVLGASPPPSPFLARAGSDAASPATGRSARDAGALPPVQEDISVRGFVNRETSDVTAAETELPSMSA